MNTLNNSDFRFFTDINISKAKDEDGNEQMRLYGIASTTDQDTDEEILLTDGFDLTPLLTRGFVNWNHKAGDAPGKITGQVYKAEVQDAKKLYVECELYPELQISKDIYNLAKTLEKRGGQRKLGFSVEGKALERDSVNPKIITKAMITGLAITPTPKNASTLAQIMKGEDDGYNAPDYSIDVDDRAQGGNEQYVIDITDEYGNRYTVDKNFKIIIEKVDKGMSTSSAAPIIPESVESDTKNLQQKQKKLRKSFLDLNKSVKFNENLHKSDIFDYIFENVEGVDLNQAKQLYNFIEVFQNNNNEDMSGITAEKIQKAFEIIGTFADNAEKIEKGTKMPDEKTQGGKSDTIEKMAGVMKKYIDKGLSKADVIKAMKEEEEYDEDDEKMEKAYDMAHGNDASQLGDKNVQKADKTDINKDKPNDVEKGEQKTEELTVDQKIEKAQKELEQLQAEKEKLEKGNTKSDDAIVKAIQELNGNISEKFTTLGTIIKSQADENEKLKEKFEKAEQEKQELESQSQGRKSFQTQSYIEKGGGQTKGSQLSVSQHKDHIIAKADTFVDYDSEDFQKGSGDNYDLAKSIETFRWQGKVTPTLTKALKSNGIELVQ